MRAKRGVRVFYLAFNSEMDAIKLKCSQPDEGNMLSFKVTSPRKKIKVQVHLLPELVKYEVHQERHSESQNPNHWIQHG